MLHAVFFVLFAVTCAKWLEHESGKRFDLLRYKGWVIATVVAALAASVLEAGIGGKAGNFLLHSIGGGVAGTLLYIYLLKTFQPQLSWRVEAAGLFAFISMLGVMNELLEYALETMGVAIMSWDTHDTWRDLVANTTGMVAAWLVIRVLLVSKRRLH